jgi:hypothetical protein
MLCLVRPKEKAELEKTIAGTFPLVFAKNQKDFRARLTEDSYLVVSLPQTELEYSRTKKLMCAFPNSAFVFFQLGANDNMPNEACVIMEEPNAVMGQYGPRELRDNYLGTIKDLWDMRCRESLPYCEEIHRAIEEWYAEAASEDAQKETFVALAKFMVVKKMLEMVSQDLPPILTGSDDNPISAARFVKGVLVFLDLQLHLQAGTVEKPVTPEKAAAVIDAALTEQGLTRLWTPETAGNIRAVFKKAFRQTDVFSDSNWNPISPGRFFSEFINVMERDYGLKIREPILLTPDMAGEILTESFLDFAKRENRMPDEAELGDFLQKALFSDAAFKYYKEASKQKEDK